MEATVQSTEAIPMLGSGIGYRAQIKDAIAARKADLDFVEIVADHFMNAPDELDELEEIQSWFPVIPHALGLSVGSAGRPDSDYVRRLKRVSDAARAAYVSDHLCMTHAPGIDIGHLSPLWFTEGVLRSTIDNVRRVQDQLGKPLVLENVTYVFEIPHAEMSQPDFFGRLIDATGCGILLDVTNVHINATNHGFDPEAFLDELPIEHVVQVHIAGGFWLDGVLIDSHSHPVEEGSWRLLRRLAERARVKGCILEHDANFDDPDLLFEQVAKARRILQREKSPVQGAAPA